MRASGLLLSLLWVLVDWVNPVDFFRLLDRVHIGDVHDDGLVVAAHQDTLQRLVGAGVDLLMGTKGGT